MARHLVLFAAVAVACTGSTPPVASPASSTPPGSTASSAKRVALPGGALGYLATPAAPGKRGAVIVIQEWWGLDDWIRANTDRFAEKGYVALAIDLYRGKTAANADEAHELMRGLPEDRALRDLHAAFDTLAARDDVDPKRIGAIGWCMGGGYALALATDEPKLRAVVINYGRLVTDDKKIEAIQASLLGNFAGQDKGISVADVASFTAALEAKKKDADVKVYSSEGHAFMNPNNKTGYRAEAAADAWSRIDAFFARTLGD